MRGEQFERAFHAPLAAEIGSQDLDADIRVLEAYGADAIGEMTRAAVTQIVAIDRGDDDVAQAHVADRAGELGRFERIGRVRTAMRDVAERTAPRAHLAEDHEGRRALAEALVDVRARGFLADRDEPVLAQLGLELGDGIAGRNAHADPRRLAQQRCLGETGAVARDLVLALLFLAGDGQRNALEFVHATWADPASGSPTGKGSSALARCGWKSNWRANVSMNTSSTAASAPGPPKSSTWVTCKP